MDERFAGVCVSIFIGALALNWAVELLAHIWIQLTVALIVIGLGAGGIVLYRWRRDRW